MLRGPASASLPTLPGAAMGLGADGPLAAGGAAIGGRPHSRGFLTSTSTPMGSMSIQSPMIGSPPKTPMSPSFSGGGSGSGAAASFLPKLMLKLTAVDEALANLTSCKVDLEQYERQREVSNRVQSQLQEEVRRLRADVNELQHQNNQLRTALQGKTDATAFNRLKDFVQELSSTCAAKADGEFASKLHADLTAANQELERMSTQVAHCASLQMLEEERRRIDLLISDVRGKVSCEFGAALRRDVDNNKATLDAVNHTLKHKVDDSTMAAAKQRLQQLHQLCQAKFDGSAGAELSTAVGALQQLSRNHSDALEKHSIGIHNAATAEQLQTLTASVRQKMTQELGAKLEAEVATAQSTLNTHSQQLQVNRLAMLDAQKKLSGLQNQADNLQQMSMSLSIGKADMDKVPQLDERMMGSF
eukprot:TRINITY_DN16064_c0_g1_i2.p1 TRINITY_DN16064_c0_g1~~TRINITY_DN16064_c0_g1_i2.p1  ORF type:complete len:417 (+),score=132.62 TRINITY_DN16064_c0_g1_i2:120-1370(+)